MKFSVSKPLEELPPQNAEISKRYFDWSKLLKYVAVPVACVGLLILSLFGLKFFSDEGIIDISVSESNHSVSVSPVPVYGEIPAFTDGNEMYYYIDRDNSADSKTEISDTDTAESDETETENNPLLSWVLRLVAVIVPIFGLKLGITIVRNTLYKL